MQHDFFAAPVSAGMPLAQYDPQQSQALWLVPAEALCPQPINLVTQITTHPGKYAGAGELVPVAMLQSMLNKELARAANLADASIAQWMALHEADDGPLVPIRPDEVLLAPTREYASEAVCPACQGKHSNCPQCQGSGTVHQLGQIHLDFPHEPTGCVITVPEKPPIEGLHSVVLTHVGLHESRFYAENIQKKRFELRKSDDLTQYMLVGSQAMDLLVQITPTPQGNQYAFGEQRVVKVPMSGAAAQGGSRLDTPIEGSKFQPHKQVTFQPSAAPFWSRYIANPTPRKLLVMAVTAAFVIRFVLRFIGLYQGPFTLIISALITAAWYQASSQLLQKPAYKDVGITFVLTLVASWFASTPFMYF